MSSLRPETKLLNHKFNGYKLASTPLEENSIPLLTPLNYPARNPNEYSYVYVRGHEMHNHLYQDTWNQMVYFVDSECRVNTLLATEDGLPSTLHRTFSIPKTEREAYPFSCSLMFPCETLAVLCDGSGYIYLVDTGLRKKENIHNWKCVEDKPLYDFQSPTSILYASIENNKDILHILTSTLREIKTENNTGSMCVIYTWLQVKLSFANLVESCVKGIKRFMSHDIPNAFWFSKDYAHFLVASRKKFHLVDVDTFEIIEPIILNGESNGHGGPKLYTWQQSKELLSFSFNLCVTENEIQCEIKYNYISVRLKNGRLLLEGSLEKEVIAEASRWYVEKNRLEVVLIKKVNGEFWNSVIPNDRHGNHIIEGEEEERMREIHDRLEHLTSSNNGAVEENQSAFNMDQLEECDKDVDEEDLKLYSVDVFSGEVKTMKNFSGHRLLFTNTADNHLPPLLCLRHNVDGILWQPDPDALTKWEHKATFDAFGFVHASKNECKFTTCSPNFKFAFITDCTSHVYIYEADQTNLYQHSQYITDFRDCKKILGCQATDRFLYILSDNFIYVVTLP